MDKQKRKSFEDDDGRVVAKMNVDGMPWYMRSEKQQTPENNDLSDLSKGETWEIVKGTVKAGLLIGGVFFVVFALFILFCIFVWFR